MLGGLGNLPGLMKQAKEMQSRMGEIQAEILTKRFDGESGGGAVRVTVDGKATLVDIKIQPDATSDVELLEDMIKGAVAAASVKAHAAAKEEMAKLTGGLNIPGLSEMLGG